MPIIGNTLKIGWAKRKKEKTLTGLSLRCCTADDAVRVGIPHLRSHTHGPHIPWIQLTAVQTYWENLGLY